MNDIRHGTRYEIHVRGLLSDRLTGAFPEMRARVRNHETVLTGALPDQSALHGVLGRIEALGLDLLEVRRARARADAACPGAAEPKADRGRTIRPASPTRPASF